MRVHEPADRVTLEVLEFPAVVEAVCRRTVTPMGRERAAGLSPTADPDAVRRLQSETTQMRALLEQGSPRASIPLAVPDVRDPLRRCAAGGTLTGPELAEVATAIEGIAELRAYVTGASGPGGPAPVLGRFSARLGEFPEVATAIRRAVGPDGEVLDSASPALASIRAELRRLNERIYEALERFVRSALGRKVLQEPIVTRRSGRYVVPVRQECRELVPGLVHDASASGATVFVEPMAVVELNNALRAAQARERDEVERVLRELSGRVGAIAGPMLEALDAVGELDAIAARARLSMDQGAVEPVLNTEGRVVLRGARHPLLPGPVVPIDIEVGRSFWVLVITGPNTGGKTVSLKTVGLLTVMAQSGLHVPAEAGSEVAIFTRIRADIGDQQSVTDSLSTFSSHLRRIVPILSEADPQTLVLLDELGAGTDPAEGSALGCAILEHLHALQARVVVTTHLGDLKVLAHMRPGMANASVAFDIETLTPTYRLVLGAPGQSQALAIASRLGVPDAIVEDARRRLGPDRGRADRLIEELHQALEAARQRLAQAAAARAEAVELLRRAREEHERLRARRHDLLQRATDEAERLVRQARQEVEALLRQARAAAREVASAGRVAELERVRRDLAETRRRLERVTTGAAGQETGGPSAGRSPEVGSGHAGAVAALEAEPVPMGGGEVLEPGMRVWVMPLRSAGRVVEKPDDQGWVLVQVGAARTRVRSEQLAWLPEAAGVEQGPGPSDRPGARLVARAASIRPEIDLRGLTADEARLELDKYLDDCTLAGVERVRVIHGKGTGALRDAVRSYLQESRRVRRFAFAAPSEGGDGVTVVELA